MDTKEFQYNDVVINGFVALFINLAILPLLVVMSFLLLREYCFVLAADPLYCSGCYDDSGIFFSGTE